MDSNQDKSLKAKNAQLEKELAHKNRELEIEAALERVRTRSMDMQKSDELKEVIQVVYDQFIHLNINIEHTGFVVDYQPGGDWNFWVADQLGSPNKLKVANYDCAWNNSFDAAKEKGIDFFTTLLNFDEKNKFYTDLFARAPEMPEQEKELIFNKPGLAVSTVLLEDVALYIENFAGTPYTDEENATLMRFGKVFQQTYTRFLDLQKAEAQAREAQIEASLERVRSRAMAMHKTDELLDAAELLYRELTNLGIASMAVTYSLMDEAEKNASYYSINPVDGKINPKPFELPHDETEVMRSLLSSWKKKEAVNLIELDEEATLKHQTYIGEKLRKYLNELNIPFSVEEFLAVSPKKAVIYTFNFAQGYIFIIGDTRLTKEQEETVLRFTKVFELTYRRFLDLKQAEEQAREAQIQLALERVRARTMAMQRSEELHEVIQLVFDQLQQLNFNIDTANFTLNYSETHDLDLWIAVAGARYATKICVPYFNHPLFDRFNNAKTKGGLYTDTLSVEERNSFFKHFFKHAPKVADERQSLIFNAPGFARSAVFMKNIVLTIINYRGAPYSDTENKVLLRFGQVFDQTYTRFNDLKQAEAQARESQIQLALERVRARTMAMQKSEELAETVYILFQQFKELGENPDQATIGIINEEEYVIEYWVTMHGEQTNRVFKFSIDEPNVTHKIYKAWKAKKKSLVIDLEGKELLDFMTYRAGMGGARINKAEKRRIINVAFFSKGLINVQSNEARSEESIKLLERFAGVFDGTYTRFLDLKQAEAQARESQIQLALERVRARTMAMQKSEELSETAAVLFQQFKELGEDPIQITIGLINETESNIEFWATDNAGNKIDRVSRMSIDEPTLLNKIYKSWKEKKRSTAIELSGKELMDWVNYRSKLSGVPDNNDYSKARRNVVAAFFSNGLISLSTPERRPPEVVRLLERFAGVFDGTYTRFLDLKQAEAQAREAQIQLGLERVRARAMAMQTTEELNPLVGTVFEELTKLDFVLARALIMIFDPETLASRWWMANPEVPEEPANYLVQNHHNPTYLAYLKAWHDRVLQWQYALKGKIKRDWDDFLFVDTELSRLPEVVIEGMKAPGQVLLTASFNNFGCLTLVSMEPLSAEHSDILLRFAKVFDMSYTRFNDLKQAEAQAREGQIQLGLERVRARAMAMQNTDELADLVGKVYEELTKLDLALTRASIWIFDPVDLSARVWMANTETETEPESYYIKYNEQPAYLSRLKAWNEQNPKWEYDLNGEDKRAYDQFILNETGMSSLADAVKSAMQAPERVILNVSFSSFGGLQIAGLKPLSGEQMDLLYRFGKVFDLTYTRFNDLKQAEAQARESQIQLALERVRARTMAMQRSEELAETAAELFRQMMGLGIEPNRLYIGIIHEETTEIEFWITDEDGSKVSEMFTGDGQNKSMKKMYDGWARKQSIVIDMQGRELSDYFHYLTELRVPFKDGLTQKRRIQYISFFSNGFIGMASPTDQSHETIGLLDRFAHVFNLTYTRFLDLKKAEEQAREGQIQLGLERVRAAAMAMHSSDDVGNATALVFSELYKLGITTIRCGVCIVDGTTKRMEVWSATSSQEGKVNRGIGELDMTTHPLWVKLWEAWKQKESAFTYELAGKELSDYYKAITNAPGYHAPDGSTLNKSRNNTGSDRQYCNCFLFNEGCLFTFTQAPFPPETSQILEKFAAVFGLTYRRFLDLTKAEAQAREAQIEAALERVRSKAMAMHNSDDLSSAASLVFTELKKLGITAIRCGVGLFSKEIRQSQLYSATISGDSDTLALIGRVDMVGHPVLDNIYDGWLNQEDYFPVLNGKELKNFYKKISPGLNMPSVSDMGANEKQYGHFLYFAEGALNTWAVRPYSETELKVLDRFKSIISLTFRRYLDLKKAEAQVREAQIEAALERVRSKTMAMHNSNDVADTVGVMFNELIKLGVEKLVRCGIGILKHNSSQMEVWTAKMDENEKTELIIGHFGMGIHKMLAGIYNAWENQEPSFSYVLEGNDMVNYFEAINNEPDYPMKYVIDKIPSPQYHNDFIFAEGVLFTFTPQPLSGEISSIFRRFAGVFGQTYRRYLDLKKAEAQAREAQIEAALERVRGKAMAMRSSEDLNATANTVFVELRKLGVDLVRCGVGLLEKQSHISTIHAATNTAEGASLEVLGKLNLEAHPVLVGIYKHWRLGEDYFPVLEGKSLRDYYKKLREDGISVPEFKKGEKQYGYFFQFPDGCLYAWSEEQESETTIRILKRFTSVIGLTYTRYMELQKAESNTKEAIKQASLDRVRAEIASMRKRSDLERITPLIWDELTILGIPFIRCGVFIMDEGQRLIHTFLSTPDGKAIGAFHIPFDTSGNFEKMVSCWRSSVPYIDHWKEEAFSQFADTLLKQGAIASKAQYMRTLPHEGIHLNFLPFLQGMLYVGNVSPLTEDNINLVQAVAGAFSTAYARYEDFNKLEAAKQQVDKTLTDLKATQTKLIQSEKMASLGELTAGIAHEIQNPLNFVNNFSEVNIELIDEMEQEIEKGDFEEVKAIANDIKENQLKIHHHGQRADGIVKGMLQHSRASSNVKEPTDINKLADEYQRLAYHGLRAKDKMFNAEMVAHFDENLPKANVVPQDIGRAILNLFTNAFYAVNQKQKTGGPDYKPTVEVSTSAKNGQVEIRVKDNGNGIRNAIKDKIMQPFFTTKPTGEGTGLGLSLSYDIVVKGHGGKIDVYTKENEFTEFTVTLPII